jgi:hypothetical protein
MTDRWLRQRCAIYSVVFALALWASSTSAQEETMAEAMATSETAPAVEEVICPVHNHGARGDGTTLDTSALTIASSLASRA